MTQVIFDAFLAVQEACGALGITLDGSEKQDLVSTLIIEEGRREERALRWPARKHQQHFDLSDGIDIGNNPPNSQAAADYVAQQKLAKFEAEAAQKKPPQSETIEDQLRASLGSSIGASGGDGRKLILDPNNPHPWNNRAEQDAVFALLREQLGERRYFDELSRWRLSSHKGFKTWKQGLTVYKHLATIVMVEQKGVA